MPDNDNPAPVKTVSKRTVASNSKWQVCFDWIEDSFGNTVEDYLVIRSLAVEPGEQITGVTVVPIIGEHIVLVRNYRYPVAAHGWEAVRGFIDEGETPAVAAARELAEETGLHVDPKSLVPLGYSWPEPSTIAGKSAMFAAPDCRPGAYREFTEAGLGLWRAHPFDAIMAMLQKHEIEDGSTEIALRRYLDLTAYMFDPGL